MATAFSRLAVAMLLLPALAGRAADLSNWETLGTVSDADLCKSYREAFGANNATIKSIALQEMGRRNITEYRCTDPAMSAQLPTASANIYEAPALSSTAYTDAHDDAARSAGASSYQDNGNGTNVGKTLLGIGAALLLGAAVYAAARGGAGGGGSSGGSSAGGGQDTDWDWDEFLDGEQRSVWVCRGVQTGQFAYQQSCAAKPQIDFRWLSKQAP